MTWTWFDECTDGNVDTVKDNIVYGTNINMNDNKGNISLYKSSAHGHLDIVQVLIAAKGWKL